MTDAAEAARLGQALQEASGEVRRAFLWFGTFGAYFATTVAATTHENLLRGTAVKLPLLNVDLPIVGFYVIAPLLFLLLHFYLLFQLYLMSARARELIGAVGSGEAQSVAPSFPVTQYLLGGLGAFRPIFGVGIWLAVILLPALALGFVQVRFLPYHSATITGLHLGLVVLDTVVVVVLWCMTIRGLGMRERQVTLELRADRRPGTIDMLGSLGYVGLFVFACLTLWFSTVVAAIPADEAQAAVGRDGAPVGASDPCAPEPVSEVAEPPPGLSPNPPDQPRFCTTFARPQDFPFLYEPLAAFEGAPKRRMLCLTFLLFEAPTTPLDMRRNLVVRGANFSSPAADASRIGTGFDLRGRDLRFADFTGSNLIGADLRGADLYGAELASALLQYADLGDVPESEFDLCEGFHATDGAGNRFCRTVARSANLERARLDGARLRKIDLRGARLANAELPRADLVEADATGAQLQSADLSGAEMRGSRLDEAGMREVRATGADLTCARARRADLAAADLTAATAGRIRLGSTHLEEARLVGTYLARADLTGARLGGAYIDGVDLRAAKMIGAVWADPALGPARLRRADLRGARVDAKAIGEADLDPDNLIWDHELGPEAPAPAAFEAGLVELLRPMLARADLRAGVLSRIESERNETCAVRPYQAELAGLMLEGACERDGRFTPAEWWVLQVARRASIGTGASDARTEPRCMTGPPPSPGKCEAQPWVPVDTPRG